MRRTRQNQRGFTMVAAIFLLVTLAALGAFMLTFSSSQHMTSAQDVQGSRAYWAARAGLEWALGSVKAAPAACPTPPSPFNVEGFALEVTCASRDYAEGGISRKVFRMTSVAKSGGSVGGLGYIERSVSATVEF